MIVPTWLGDFVVAEVDVSVAEGGADAEQLEQLTRALREEILTLDVESVVPRYDGEAPPGTRAVDAAAIGALVVSVAPALEALGRLVTTVVEPAGGDSLPAPLQRVRFLAS